MLYTDIHVPCIQLHLANSYIKSTCFENEIYLYYNIVFTKNCNYLQFLCGGEAKNE